MAVIAHELGHIKCGHVLYKTMARGIKPFLEIAGKVTLGVGELVGAGVEAGLTVWDRRSELSADRAALLATQDSKSCISMLMKLAGGTSRHAEWLDTEQFLNQARAYKEGLDDKMSDRFYRFLANVGATHPFPVERARPWMNGYPVHNTTKYWLAITQLQFNYPRQDSVQLAVSRRNRTTSFAPTTRLRYQFIRLP